jgi:hypothetical protein
MLYLVGGASRAGKSTLARRLLVQCGIPYFSLDVLMMGLAHGWPQSGVDPDAPVVRGAAHLWPVIRAMAVNLLEEETTHPRYLLEGDLLLPAGVAELRQASPPGAISACFLGYAHVSPQDKLRQVRAVEPDWFTYALDKEAVDFLGTMVAFSRHLERECSVHGLPYVDCSAGMEQAREHALAVLLASR